MAIEKIQPSSVSFQSSGADLVMPISLVIGRLKTLNAYTWPMQRWMHRAAGGTIQRLNPGLAIVRLRSKNDKTLIRRVPPWSLVRSANVRPLSRRSLVVG